MRKLYPLLSVLFLIYWGCEDEKDTTPTEVTLWGEVYSVENTNSLDLSGNSSNGWDGGLTGEIPLEIGNLTSLTSLSLSYNQLTGEIPPEVCDLIENNNLLKAKKYLQKKALPRVVGNSR